MTVRAERRRRWSAEEKLRIIRETLRPGAVVQAVADQNGIGTGLLYTWRKQMLTAAITGFAAVETVVQPQAAPLLPAPAVAVDPSDTAVMEVAVEVDLPNGARVRVGNGAGAALLCDVFAALDRR
ncbi:MAG: transposase [Acetobacteraceae bacterium]